MTTADLSYPVGRFTAVLPATSQVRAAARDDIASFPARMRTAVKGLSPAQLDTPYRPGGWTVRQVVHHVADSHMNAFIRFKLALTEEEPTIKPYNQAAWAGLDDARAAHVELSLALIEALHGRWALLLRAMKPEDFARAFRHPEHLNAAVSLDRNLAMYAWHGAHHT